MTGSLGTWIIMTMIHLVVPWEPIFPCRPQGLKVLTVQFSSKRRSKEYRVGFCSTSGIYCGPHCSTLVLVLIALIGIGMWQPNNGLVLKEPTRNRGIVHSLPAVVSILI